MPWLPSFESVRDLGDRRKAWWSKPASTVVGATVHHSGRQSAHEVIMAMISQETCLQCSHACQMAAISHGRSHVTCLTRYDLMGPLPTAVVPRGAHDGRCWL